MDTSPMINSCDRGSSPRQFEQIIGSSPALEMVLKAPGVNANSLSQAIMRRQISRAKTVKVSSSNP
jgi:hypothetical protein